MGSQGFTQTLAGVLCALSVSFQARANIVTVTYKPSMNYAVTPDAARTIARTWSGDSTLVWSSQPVKVLYDTDAPSRARYKLFANAGDGSRQQFWVDPYTGQIGWWHSHTVERAMLQSKQANQPPVYSQEQIEQVALAFARARYPDFDTLGLQQYWSGEGGVSFHARLPNGAWYTGNGCSLGVSPYTGAVYQYLGVVNEPVNIDINPTLSAAQAEVQALSYYLNGDPTPIGERASSPRRNRSAFTTDPSELWVTRDGFGAQRLVWEVPMAAGTEPGMTLARWLAQGNLGAYRYDVQIDAHTGEFVDDESYLGSPEGRHLKGWRSRAMYALPVARSNKRGKAAPAAKAKPTPARVMVDGRAVDPLAVTPRVVDGRVVWYLGYVRGPLWKMQLRRDGTRVTVTTPTGEQIVLEDGKPFLRRSGESVPLKTAPVVLAGRTYIGLDAWRTLTGGRFVWAPATRTLMVQTLSQTAARAR